MSADSDIAIIGRELKADKQRRRAKMKAENTAALLATGLHFESKNDGAHLIVNGFNFWPSTGRWHSRLMAPGVKMRKGFGLKSLVDELQKDAL